MANSVLTNIDQLGSCAASGTVNATIAVPQGTQKLVIKFGAEYAAVAGTSGITASLQTSVDGTTWVAANEASVKITPAAGVLGQGLISLDLANSPFAKDFPSYLNSVKVTLTNADATNAATTVITHQALNRAES